MAKDSGGPPLPRRMPGAAGSPRPPTRVGPPVLPESVRQHLLTALANAPERAAQEPTAAQEPAAQEPAAANEPAAEELTAEEPEPAPEQAEPVPQLAPVANDLRARSVRVSRGTLPPSGARLLPDAEALTEPFPRFAASSRGDTPTRHVAQIPAQPDISGQRSHQPPQREGDGEDVAASALEHQGVPRRAGRRERRFGQGHRIAAALIVMMALITAVSLAVALSGHTIAASHRGGESSSAASRAAATRKRAAAWVASQVSPTAPVFCDRLMCQALKSDGFPPSELQELGPTTTSPLGSDVIVATAAIRDHFGSLLGSVYAPALIASFGSGPTAIDIRQVAPHGAAAYTAELNADLRNRKADGAALLSISRIVPSVTARKQLEAGQADTRLLVAIADMASVQSIYIVAFGSSSPGADPDLPLRFAEVMQAAPTLRPTSRPLTVAFVRSMTAFLRTQDGPYRPAQMGEIRPAGGTAVLRIGFTAPSPLGLHSGHHGL